jgi:uncharacterized protein (TIGR02145 family)
MTAGSFPDGVTSTDNGSSYTITGAPTVTGLYVYSLTAVASGCSSTAVSGTIGAVSVAIAPPGAASTQTWVVGSQTWSAPLMKAQTGCTETTDFGSTNPPTSALYRTSGLNSGSGYLYNWKCLSENMNSDDDASLCPSPWRVPTMNDFVNLDKELGGTGANRENVSPSWIASTYLAKWGGDYHGYAMGLNVYAGGLIGYYTSRTTASGNSRYILWFTNAGAGAVAPRNTSQMSLGLEVRCVKD